MPRPAYPTQVRDHLGNEIRLPTKPFATGGEGAVFDVVGRSDLVAKLYNKPQSRDRCDKLHAMAKLCSPELLKIAAWPTATLSDGNPLAVAGILMPRIAHYKEIHHLYSVAQRKKDFPEADWGFLLHTARNCAIAFETIHHHGHIVGDVNQKNVIVSNKGIVALVDCNSFQVKEGSRVFRCGVGVPEYTPPELHGRKFTDLDRESNHDLFGLAVMIFHLLMMGRHPFSGVPQVSVDIPIEKAIQDGLYAYARNPTKLKPPPHVPPLSMLDASTRDLFERAFRSTQRPTAAEWRRVLDDSMKRLQRCKNDPRHSYPETGTCPWCQLIAVARLMFFIPSQGTGGPLRIDEIRKLIHNLAGKQLIFPSYMRPTPSLPIDVILPKGLRSIPKPALLQHPAPPAPAPKPSLLPAPPPPVLLALPILRPLPVAPDDPPAPSLRAHPPAPVELPRPKLHAIPQVPEYPPLPTPTPPDLFLETLCIIMSMAGGLLYFVAWQLGTIMFIGFGVWWLLMKCTEGVRIAMAQKSLKMEHEAECARMDEGYQEQVRPIQRANEKLLDVWNRANAAAMAKHAQLCMVVEEENRRRLAPWEEAKATVQAEHQRITKEIERANRRVLLAMENEKNSRQAAYDAARREIEQENQRRTSTWAALMDSQQAEHRKKCDEIDSKNKQLVARWEIDNAPWIREAKRWRDRASAAEAEIKRMEAELIVQRQDSLWKFQQRKANCDDLIKSHNGVWQDYDRELRQAETDSKRIQLEEHLEKSLIRRAKLKGITGDRVLALESFGIETARDVTILHNQKVPGIGPVLSQRLFEWRDKLSLSFRPQQGVPESEKRRLASQYTPVLVPLGQAIQVVIQDLESIAVAHRAREVERVTAIAAVVQNRAVAEAHFRAMGI